MKVDYYGSVKEAVPPELGLQLKMVSGDTLRDGEEWFCPFGLTHIRKECFENDCSYLKHEKGCSSCSFFKEQIKKRGNVKRFTEVIFVGDDTRGIIMDLMSKAMEQNLIPKRIVVDKYRLSWNPHHHKYVYKPPSGVTTFPEWDSLPKAEMVESKEIPIIVRTHTHHDAITVEAL